MTGIQTSVRRDGRYLVDDIDQLSRQELAELAERRRGADDGWHYVTALVEWMRGKQFFDKV